jgi:hypothetical protein
MTSTTTSGDDDEEYKSMYHATYRASTFALRRYLNAPSPPLPSLPSEVGESKSFSSAPDPFVPRLEKEKAMTMIDEFLKLFCQEGQ